MGISGGPDMIQDGLVLSVDVSDGNSFRGEPTVNLAPNPDFRLGTTGWNANQNVTITTSSFVDGPYLTVVSNQTSSTPGFLTADIAVSSSTSYSLSLTGYHNGTGSAYLYASGNGTGGSNIVWFTAPYGPRAFTTTLSTLTSSFVTPADMTTLKIGALWSGVNTLSTMYVKSIQLEQKAYPTPFVSGTRGTTVATGGGLADLSGNGYNGTVTSSLIYNNLNRGSLLFDGTSSYIPLDGTINLGNTFTILSWIKLSTLAGGEYIVYGTDANGADNWFGFISNTVWLYGTETVDVNNFSLTGGSITSTGSWYNIGCTISGSVAKVYLNGVEQNSTTKAFTIGAWNSSGNSIGRRGSLAQRYLPGNIATVQAYNRVLSSTEILQNYNTLKSRFNL